MKVKKPTQRQKIDMYEKFLHDIQMYEVSGRHDLIAVLIGNACNWSYAHRCGNGELSDDQQDQLVADKFWKLTTVPDVLK